VEKQAWPWSEESRRGDEEKRREARRKARGEAEEFPLEPGLDERKRKRKLKAQGFKESESDDVRRVMRWGADCDAAQRARQSNVTATPAVSTRANGKRLRRCRWCTLRSVLRDSS